MIHFTSLEQSKKLLELGIDPTTCDATYHPNSPVFLTVGQDLAITKNLPRFTDGQVVPCWSDGALLDLLTKDCMIEITKKVIPYFNEYTVTHSLLYTKFKSHSLTDALFDMLCWIKQNTPYCE